jgi:glutathione peroxidase
VTADPENIYAFRAHDISGVERALADWRGKVLLVVNTASACGFTPQYAELEQLHRDYREQGLAVLGFPCNQFGGQEPGDGETIARFCSTRYEVDFPLFAKVEVNGPGAHPLWRWLTREAGGLLGTRAIKWNFTKFLVGRDGRVRSRHAPGVRPEALRPRIERLLAEPAPRQGISAA